MTPQIISVLSILAVAVFFLVTEWIPMEVVALLVLGVLAISGLLNPTETLAGFSNPAVVTVWAVFILSGGLTRTGVANTIGRIVLRMAGRGETLMVIVIMISGGVMSAFMNNVAVAALMLPVVMDIARQTGHPPSRLLMPLAYGTLLGGLTTLIGTPPNILVSDALGDGGLKPFTLFDYTPVGAAVMVTGVAFMALVGRHLLGSRDLATKSSTAGHLNLRQQYDLHERMFGLRLPRDSVLVGKSLRESHLGSTLGVHVLGVIRNSRTQLAPDPDFVIQAGDRLIVEGRLERRNELKSWRQLVVEKGRRGFELLFSPDTGLAEVQLTGGSALADKTLDEIGFGSLVGVNVLAIRRDSTLLRDRLQEETLKTGDILLIQGRRKRLEALKTSSEFAYLTAVSPSDLADIYRLEERIMLVRVPQASALMGKTLKESRLGDALELRVLCIIRKDGSSLIPEPEDQLEDGDRLVVHGKLEHLLVLRGLEELLIERERLPDVKALESARVGLIEAMLSPETTLAGKTLKQLHFREKYGLSVLAIWRQGRPYRSNLRDMTLHFGDAMLLYGPREKLDILGREPDFLVLTQTAQQVPRVEKAKVSLLIMGCVLLPVMMGLIPIYIAAVIGAALMVLTRCLTMEEAYRCIEWKAVFLIAGMLPLGTALDKTGAAKFLAEGVVAMLGPLGPLALMTGLMLLTFLATCFIPTAALVVLMAPIVLSTSAEVGVSPYALMMAIAMASSASFMTPVSHPANILVMGPGGYRFIDYMKVGLPLTLVVLLTVVLVLPVFWPFSP